MSVVVIVHEMLKAAVAQRASDIHCEPTAQAVRIRFRIDGVLYDQPCESTIMLEQLISCIKVMAHLDIAEKRLPHDGKFQFEYDGRPVDVRVSTFPSEHGENMVLRMLDRAEHMINLQNLGFSESMLAHIVSWIDRQQGFIIVTGPTGSGKTTTLYAALAYLNSPEKHIVTLEDPIEYHLEGITQGHINTEVGFTFERGIRAMLRQDPDIVMVGEMRDQQTAGIAIEAALTGHLVLSTMHTNDAPGALMRLMDMGIEPFLINAALTGICAQRLARKLCDACKIKRAPTLQEEELLRHYQHSLKHVYDAPGCAACDGRGVKGRIGIFQLMKITEELRALITHNPHIDAVTTQAYADGMEPLFADALTKVKEGVISLNEMLRVVQ